MKNPSRRKYAKIRSKRYNPNFLILFVLDFLFIPCSSSLKNFTQCENCMQLPQIIRNIIEVDPKRCNHIATLPFLPLYNDGGTVQNFSAWYENPPYRERPKIDKIHAAIQTRRYILCILRYT